VDIAKGVGCPTANIWLAQDGFDYPFQVDYGKQWEWMVESVRQIADRDPTIRIGLEPKPREPRNRCFIDSVPTALLLAEETGRKNVGVTVDVGHTLVEFRNMAQAVVTAARKGRLFHLHINDNSGGWDDDMIVGSVRQIEFLELFYHLRKLGYEGWCAVDIFPYREDSVKAVEESMAYMQKFEDLIDAIGLDAIGKCLDGDDATASIRLLRKSIFK
ncbi:MAG: sugar phosphate isomerase/epimerase, partial [Planctomycetes bacterium]|nr:sugar phosphate isomerase/epimerase [Planctomycetota bacterium]